MAKTRNTEVEEVEEVETNDKEEVETPKSNKDSVVVTWRGGSREYSKALHGVEFMALATEFAEKKKGTLV